MARRIALWAACASFLFPIVSCSGSDHATLFMPSGGAGGASGGTDSTGTSGTAVGGASDTTGASGGTDPTGAGGATSGTGGSLGGSGGVTATGGSGGLALDAGSGVCLANTDCPTDQYCKKIGCGSLTQGRCAVRPTTCDSAESVVCGCDGFTYFNGCLAESSGQNLRTHDPCVDTAVRCASATDAACGTRKTAYCAFLLIDQKSCQSDTIRGRCWILPETCPQTLDHYDACGGAEKCMHACDAIKTEKPMFRNSVCD